ncbi:MAG TPA: hypothetical protein VEG28_00955 [Dehalococcoidia bacterium]|nr:hypothetical protein [Dehalococcoidia bacterium]
MGDPDEYIHVRCKKCGGEYGFFPERVMVLGECKCGASDWGSPLYDWPNNKFGDFELVAREIWKLRLSIPNFLVSYLTSRDTYLNIRYKPIEKSYWSDLKQSLR